ncbi:MAG: hypothetical protein P8163_11130 [Candidatus Thiodiazotropha sp.]
MTTESTNPDDLEPFMLQGLEKLTAAQQALAEFIEVDIDLLAGVGSGGQENHTDAADDAALDAWLDKLPKSEVRGYLRGWKSAHDDANKGGKISLLDNHGNTVHIVSYSKGQARTQGQTTLF